VKLLIATCLLILSVFFTASLVGVTDPDIVAEVVFDQDVTVTNTDCFSITTMDYGAEPQAFESLKTIYIDNTAKQQNKNFERQQSF